MSPSPLYELEIDVWFLMDHPVVDIGVVLDSIDIAAWVPQAEMYYLLVVSFFKIKSRLNP